MWSSSGRRVLQELLSLTAVRGFRGTAAQNTVVVERWWQVPLSKVGKPPRLNPRRHRIYRVVEDKKHLPKEKMELILTETVPKFGGRGDTVFVKKSVGRNKLLAQGLATYASPENKQMFAEELRLQREGSLEERRQTRTGMLTVEFLKKSKLNFMRMPCDDYHISKDVVIRQLARKLGVIALPHTVNFPFESAKDVGEYWCEITVNGLDTVRLPISVLPYEDMSTAHQKQLRAQRKQKGVAADSAAAEAAEGTEAVAFTDVASDVSAAIETEAVDNSAAKEMPATMSAEAPTETTTDPSAADVAIKEKQDVLKVVSGTTVQGEAINEEVGKSIDEESAAPAQTAQDTTAPVNESPEKK